jgi:tryptophan-rich sensory protein
MRTGTDQLPSPVGQRPPADGRSEPVRRPPAWLGAGLFAAGTLGLGMLPMPLAVALAPAEGLPAIAPGLHLPPRLFGVAWAIIYPSLGVATWLVWARRARPGAPEALAVFGLSYLFFLAFLPLAAAAHDQRVTAMLDAFGLVCAYVTAWAYRRADPRTLGWLAPLLIWMPTTTLLKVATL